MQMQNIAQQRIASHNVGTAGQPGLPQGLPRGSMPAQTQNALLQLQQRVQVRALFSSLRQGQKQDSWPDTVILYVNLEPWFANNEQQAQANGQTSPQLQQLIAAQQMQVQAQQLQAQAQQAANLAAQVQHAQAQQAHAAAQVAQQQGAQPQPATTNGNGVASSPIPGAMPVQQAQAQQGPQSSPHPGPAMVNGTSTNGIGIGRPPSALSAASPQTNHANSAMGMTPAQVQAQAALAYRQGMVSVLLINQQSEMRKIIYRRLGVLFVDSDGRCCRCSQRGDAANDTTTGSARGGRPASTATTTAAAAATHESSVTFYVSLKPAAASIMLLFPEHYLCLQRPFILSYVPISYSL